MRVRQFLSEYRWPLYLSGLLGMAIVAYGVLIYVATRPNSPRPIPNYYESAQKWDADEAVEAASRQLGWTVRYEIPAGVPHIAGTPRPVDIRVTDREGKGVSSLKGRLFALRPSDQRLNQTAELVELPHEAGCYRALVRVDVPGTWEFRVDATRDSARFVHAARVPVAPDTPADAGEGK